jgi:hypothetical protein
MAKKYVLLLFLWIPALLNAQVSIISSDFNSIGSVSADAVKGCYSTSDGGFISLVNLGGQARLLKMNVQLDTVQSMAIHLDGFEPMDFRMDPNGFLHALGRMGDSTVVFVSTEYFDSISTFYFPGLQLITSFLPLVDSTYIMSGYIEAPDFPVHCCSPLMQHRHQNGTLLHDFGFTFSHGRSGRVEEWSNNRFVAMGYALNTAPNDIVDAYDLSDYSSVFQENFGIGIIYDMSVGPDDELMFCGTVINGCRVEDFDALSNSDSLTEYDALSTIGTPVIHHLGDRGFLLAYGKGNGNGQDSLVIHFLDNAHASLLHFGFSMGEQFQPMGWIAESASTFLVYGDYDQDTGAAIQKDIFYLRFTIDDQRFQPEIYSTELIVYPNTFENELTFEGDFLVPELITELTITDISGRPVNYSYHLQNGKFVLNFQDLADGVYVYRMQHNYKKYEGKVIHLSK